MENNKTYLVSDLASELNIPRTTVNDWLKIYGPYLESELRGKRKVYPERSLKILQEVITLSVFVPFAIFYMGDKRQHL